MSKQSIYDMVFEIHGSVKKIEGRMDSLQCTRNEEWIDKVEKKIDKVPSRLLTIFLGLSMLLVGCVGIYQTSTAIDLKNKMLKMEDTQ